MTIDDLVTSDLHTGTGCVMFCDPLGFDPDLSIVIFVTDHLHKMSQRMESRVLELRDEIKF